MVLIFFGFFMWFICGEFLDVWFLMQNFMGGDNIFFCDFYFEFIGEDIFFFSLEYESLMFLVLNSS